MNDIIYRIKLCIIASLIGYSAAYQTDVANVRNKGIVDSSCLAPELEAISGSLLDVTSNGGFPLKSYQKYIKKAAKKGKMKKKIKELLKLLKGESTRLQKTLYADSSYDYYPACWYKTMCISVRTIVNYLQVVGTNCWTIQPIIWTSCGDNSLAEDFSCVDPSGILGIGFTCLPDYYSMMGWVYCTSGTNRIKTMSVNIPYKCTVKKYRCATA